AEPNIVRHPYGDDPDQFVEVHGDPATASAVVVFVHGGYFRPSIDFVHAKPLAQALAETGGLCVLVEYGRIGGQPRCLDDVTAAISFALDSLEAWGVAAEARDRPVVAGHSPGGGLVLPWASHLDEDGPD
ncbi:alpha/beta hydrolase, partial [Burkholderia multivorans]